MSQREEVVDVHRAELTGDTGQSAGYLLSTGITVLHHILPVQ